MCEIEGESVLESSRNGKSTKKRELDKERERDIAKEMIRNELEKEKEW